MLAGVRGSVRVEAGVGLGGRVVGFAAGAGVGASAGASAWTVGGDVHRICVRGKDGARVCGC